MTAAPEPRSRLALVLVHCHASWFVVAPARRSGTDTHGHIIGGPTPWLPDQ